MGLSRVPLLCAREIPVAGALPRVIRVLMHCYPPVGVDPQHVYLGEARKLGWTSKAPNRLRAMALEFASKVRRIPVYPAADGYASEGPIAKLASNESPYPPLPAVVEAVTQGAGRRSTAIPTRPTRRCAAAWPTATASRPNRIAIGNGSCDILLAAGDALLEPGAELVYAWPSFSVYPHLAAASGARAIEVPVDAEHRHDLEAMRARDHRRHAAGDRLQPEQPDLDRAAARRDRRLRRRRPAPRLRDPRRGLLRVQHAPGPRRVARAARQAPEPRAPAHVLARSTGCAGCASATGCAARRSSAPRSTRCASRSSATPPPRPRRWRRSTTRTRSTRRVERNLAERIGLEDGLRELGIEPGRVAGELRLVRPRRRARGGRGHAAAWPSAACSCAPAARSAARARCGSPSAPQAENERFLEALAALL